MKNLLKYFWNDKVSLALFIVSLCMLIGWFTKGLDMTPFLAGVLCLYIIFQTNERGRFFDNFYYVLSKFPAFRGITAALGLPPTNRQIKQKRNLLEIIVLTIIVLGSLFMLGAVIYVLIFSK